jgi:helix-turn-helix protein
LGNGPKYFPDKFLFLKSGLGDRAPNRPGWTQVELAEKVGIDRSFLADVERLNRPRPTPS